MSNGEGELGASLRAMGQALERIEQRLGLAAPMDQQTLDYLFGTLAAIDFVVKRLLASHAQMFPEGISQRLLDNEDEVLDSLDRPDLPEAHRVVMKHHLKMMFRDARVLSGDDE
jgi:hypothetical protein